MEVAGPLYVWHLFSTEHERRLHREDMVTCFLNVPAFAEIVLAWTQSLYDRKQRITGSPSYATTYHQSKSLSLMGNMLQTPSNVQGYALLGCIIGNMALNQECRDWTSFNINLKGLRQVIAIHGGADALRNENLRASIIVEDISKTLVDQNDGIPSILGLQRNADL